MDLPISTELCKKLSLWSEGFNNNLNINNRSLSGFKSLEEEILFTDKGWELKQCLEDELGNGYMICLDEYPIGFYTKNIMKYIKLMPDYECFPLWHNGKDVSGNIDPVTLPLSSELKEKLDNWSNYYDSLLNWADPSSSDFKCENDKYRFILDGKRIKQLIKAELGDNYDIVYFYE